MIDSLHSIGEMISISVGEFSSSSGCLNNQFLAFRELFLKLLPLLLLILPQLLALLVLLLPSKLLFLDRLASYRSPYITYVTFNI